MVESVVINEVGLRDGLQNQLRPISTANKLELVQRLPACGIRSLEVTSFVHLRQVPQMADAETVIAGLPTREDLRYTALIPNLRGYKRARAAGVRQLALALGTTDTFNRYNINLSLEEAPRVCREVLAQARADEVPVCVYLACACACPYEGVTPLDRVLALAGEMLAIGGLGGCPLCAWCCRQRGHRGSGGALAVSVKWWAARSRGMCAVPLNSQLN